MRSLYLGKLVPGVWMRVGAVRRVFAVGECPEISHEKRTTGEEDRGGRDGKALKFLVAMQRRWGM